MSLPLWPAVGAGTPERQAGVEERAACGDGGSNHQPVCPVFALLEACSQMFSWGPCNSSSRKRTVTSAPFVGKDSAALACPLTVQKRPSSLLCAVSPWARPSSRRPPAWVKGTAWLLAWRRSRADFPSPHPALWPVVCA